MVHTMQRLRCPQNKSLRRCRKSLITSNSHINNNIHNFVPMSKEAGDKASAKIANRTEMWSRRPVQVDHSVGWPHQLDRIDLFHHCPVFTLLLCGDSHHRVGTARLEAGDSSPVFFVFFQWPGLPRGLFSGYCRTANSFTTRLGSSVLSSRGKANTLMKRTIDEIGTSFTCRVHLSAHRH